MREREMIEGVAMIATWSASSSLLYAFFNSNQNELGTTFAHPAVNGFLSSSELYYTSYAGIELRSTNRTTINGTADPVPRSSYQDGHERHNRREPACMG